MSFDMTEMDNFWLGRAATRKPDESEGEECSLPLVVVVVVLNKTTFELRMDRIIEHQSIVRAVQLKSLPGWIRARGMPSIRIRIRLAVTT